MPKLFGLNLLGLVIASIAFFALGFVWYGIIFDQQMMALMGYDENTVGHFTPAVGMALGFLNVLAVSLGIGLILRWLDVKNWTTALGYGLFLGAFFALTTTAYGWIYGTYPIKMAVIDGGYTLIGYGLVAAIWSFFD